jgi:DNA-binding SARP family transcriptional activator
LDPVEWHRAILAELETGHAAQALQELQLLVEAHPAYLPGRFEHALALRRAGRSAAAADALRSLMDLATGRDLDEAIDGPEPLSLEFYVTSARSFLESAGGRP